MGGEPKDLTKSHKGPCWSGHWLIMLMPDILDTGLGLQRFGDDMLALDF
jgi:hypothetical protein